jgi:MFS family permease
VLETSTSRRTVLRRAAQHRSLRRALAAYLAFNLAELGTWIAILVWAYDIGGIRATSLMAIASLLPAAVVAPMAAGRLDRMNHGRALSLGYASQGLAFLATGVLLVTHVDYPVVVGSAILGACTVTLTRPVHFAFLPQLAETTEDLTAGNGFSSVAEGVAAFGGPLISALLTGWLGVGAVFVAFSVTSFLGATLTSGLPERGPTRAIAPPKDQRGIAGMREIRKTPGTFALVGVSGLRFVIVGMLDILFVSLAIDGLHMSHAGPGLLNSATGVGAVIGGLITLLLVRARRLTPLLAIGAVLLGVPLLLLGGSSSIGSVIIFVFLVGVGQSLFDVTARTLTQRALPDHLLGVVFGLQETMIMVGLLLGSILAPLLVTGLGVHGSFTGAGISFLLLAFAALPKLRRLDKEMPVPMHTFRVLADIPMFGFLSKRVLERLAISATTVELPAAVDVVAQGAVGDNFYAILTGEVAVTVDGRPVRTLGAGDWFGEVALLRDIPRTATVTTRDTVRLAVLSRAAFLSAVTGAPPVYDAVHTHIAGYDEPETRT